MRGTVKPLVLCSMLTTVETSCLCSVLPKVKPVIYVHFIYSRTSCLIFSLNYSRTSYLCSVLTAVEPHV